MANPGGIGGSMETVAETTDRDPSDTRATKVGVRTDEPANLEENAGGRGHDAAERLATN